MKREEQEAAAAEVSADPYAHEIENATGVTKCPSCGGGMEFDAEKGKLVCPYCGCEQEIEAAQAEELGFEKLLRADNGWAEESHVFRCERCGAREVLDRREIAKTCSFCGASNIVETEELPGLRPNAVLPFRLTDKEAGKSVKKWIRKRIFAPQKFRKSAKPEDLRGVYSPAFTFDAATSSDYSAVLGEYYYVTRRVNGRTVSERKIRYFNVSGHYNGRFDDVLVRASDAVGQASLDKLQPFGTNDSKEYTREYLSGYTASQYSRDGAVCWAEAKQIMADRLRSQILSRYTYDVVSSFNINTSYSNITYKYVLLPLYVGHCTWRQKLYNFFVNGVNGKVTGKAPVSPLKVGALVLLGAAIIVGLYFLFRYMS